MANIRFYESADAPAVHDLFTSTFADAEGPAERELIGSLVHKLLAITPADDLTGFVVSDAEQIVGCVLFSRLKFTQPIEALLLSPMAVRTSHQGQGIGQQLIRHALAELQQRGVQIVVTYGDPAFYGKVGFHSLSTQVIEPPFPLSQPIGWLGQKLAGQPITDSLDRCQCVAAFDDPALW